MINQHYKGYFNDLYAIYSMCDALCFEKQVVSYEQLACHLLNDSHNNKQCLLSDYILFPSWGLLLSSHYGMPQLALKHNYQWSGAVLDIKDCGSLCIYRAIEFIMRLSLSGLRKIYTCCMIENKCDVSTESENALYPAINYVGLLSLSNQKDEKAGFKIYHCSSFKSRSIQGCLKLVKRKIQDLTKLHALENVKGCVLLARQSMLDAEMCAAIVLDFPVSSGFVLYALNNIVGSKSLSVFNYFYILDQDVLSKTIGLLLIQRVNDHDL